MLVYYLLAKILVETNKRNAVMNSDESVEGKTNVTSFDYKDKITVFDGNVKEVLNPFYTKSLDVKNQDQIQQS